jgi:hypothetical protein
VYKLVEEVSNSVPESEVLVEQMWPNRGVVFKHLQQRHHPLAKVGHYIKSKRFL